MEARIYFNYDCYGIHGHGHDTTLRPTTFDGYVCASYLAFYLYRWICSASIFIWIPYPACLLLEPGGCYYMARYFRVLFLAFIVTLHSGVNVCRRACVLWV